MKLRQTVGWAVIGISLIGAGVLGAMRDYRYGGDLVWASGYEKGLAQAQASHRPMLISFHSTGCDWCRKMDAETFTDSRVVALSHNFVCVRIDALREPGLAQMFQVTQYPETIIGDEHARIIAYLDGYSDAPTMAKALQQYAPIAK